MAKYRSRLVLIELHVSFEKYRQELKICSKQHKLIPHIIIVQYKYYIWIFIWYFYLYEGSRNRGPCSKKFENHCLEEF